MKSSRASALLLLCTVICLFGLAPESASRPLSFLYLALGLLLVCLLACMPRLGGNTRQLPDALKRNQLRKLSGLLGLIQLALPLQIALGGQLFDAASEARYLPVIIGVIPASAVLTLNLATSRRSLFWLSLSPVFFLLPWAILAEGISVQTMASLTIALPSAIALVHLAYRQRQHFLLEKHHLQRKIEHLQSARSALETHSRLMMDELSEREETEHLLRDERRDLKARVQGLKDEAEKTRITLTQQEQLRRNISEALVKSQMRLTQAIEASGLALWDWDVNRSRINQSFFHSAFGPKEVSTHNYLVRMRKMIPPSHWQEIRHQLIRCLKGQTPMYRVQYPVHLPDGEVLWVEDCGKAIEQDDESGRVTRLLGTRRDISREKRNNEQLTLAQSVFDHTNDGIFALDSELRFITINKAFSEITGFSAADVVGKRFIDISSTPRKQQVYDRIQETLISEGLWEGELYEKRKGGDYFIEWLQIKAITNEAGRVTHYAGLFIDMTERRQNDEKINYLIHYDDLTGLANRVLFRDRLHNMLSRLRKSGDSAALLLIDVDRFRQVNEGLGHDQGDELLKQIALRISRVSQEADTVARLGNDEYAVIWPRGDRESVQAYCEVLHNEVRAPYTINGHEYFFSLSIGIALAPEHGREIHALMRQADVALHQAKYLGGNVHEFYSKTLQNLTSQRLDLETELRRAIQKNQIQVYYQPKYHLDEERIESMEALVRWSHPERGLIAPGEFVGVAEESGLIAAIGEQVLLQACRQSAAWKAAGLGSIRVSVNVSAFQLRQNNLVQRVREVLDETGLPPELLDLELTESALMENFARTAFTLNRLRQMGIHITIDDFGTGYSSLAYLKRFPLSALKIDRVFVKDAPDNAEDAAITRAISLLGQSLNLNVIAEGVETREQLDFVRELHCEAVQGYFISHPVPAQEAGELLKRQLISPVPLLD